MLSLIIRMKTTKWIVRIVVLLITIFGLFFYFAYGNPLPFVNPEYTIHDNLWLSIFPLMFLGLIIGLVNQKVGGYLTTIPLFIGFIVSIIIKTGFSIHIMIPFTIGIIYLIIAYKKNKKKS